MKHLLDAAENYNCAHNGKIRPISTVDGEIIKELVQILSSKGGTKDLVKILKKWKKDQDGFVLDELIQYSLSIDEDEESTGGGKSEKLIPFLSIKDTILKITTTCIIIKRDAWSSSSGRRMFYIIINPKESVSQGTPSQDVFIEFYSEEERDENYNKLKNQLETNANVKFLNVE